MSIRVTTTVTCITPQRTVAHKIRGVQYHRPVLPRTSVTTRVVDQLDLGEVGLRRLVLAAIAERRLVVHRGSLAERYERDLGYARLRRSWSIPATDERYVVEVSAEQLASGRRHVAPARPLFVHPQKLAHRDMRRHEQVQHRLFPLDPDGRGYACVCGASIPVGRSLSTVDALHTRLLPVLRTQAPVYP